MATTRQKEAARRNLQKARQAQSARRHLPGLTPSIIEEGMALLRSEAADPLSELDGRLAAANYTLAPCACPGLGR